MEFAQSCYGRGKVVRAIGPVFAFNFVMSRIIRLNGREAAVLKSIGFGLGVTGQELQERMQMAHEDLSDVLNTLLDIGYVETTTMRERVRRTGRYTGRVRAVPNRRSQDSTDAPTT